MKSWFACFALLLFGAFLPQTGGAQTVYRAVSAAPTACAGPGCQGDFAAWLDGARAQYGLAPITYDANLTAWPQWISDQQSVRGLGQFVMGTDRRRNAAMAPYATSGAMWLASPPTARPSWTRQSRRIGCAGSGCYWPFDAP